MPVGKTCPSIIAETSISITNADSDNREEEEDNDIKQDADPSHVMMPIDFQPPPFGKKKWSNDTDENRGESLILYSESKIKWLFAQLANLGENRSSDPRHNRFLEYTNAPNYLTNSVHDEVCKFDTFTTCNLFVSGIMSNEIQGLGKVISASTVLKE